MERDVHAENEKKAKFVLQTMSQLGNPFVGKTYSLTLIEMKHICQMNLLYEN